MKSQNKKNFFQFGLILLFISVICGFLMFFINKNYEADFEQQQTELIQQYQEKYDTILHVYRQMARLYYEEVVTDRHVLSTVYLANFASEDVRNGLREYLNNLLLETYLRAKEKDFRQFHFVLKDNISFLRMHQVDKFGDDLTDVRESVRICNYRKSYVEGFEEGRLYNGYRFQFPLSYEGEHIGTVETSLSYVSITKLMESLFGTPGIFLVKSEIVEEKVLEEFFEKNYGSITFSNDYVADQETLGYFYSFPNENQIAFDLIQNEEFQQQAEKLMASEESAILHMSQNDHEISIVFLSVRNISNQHAAYLVFFDQNISFGKQRIGYLQTIWLTGILWLMLCVIIMLIYWAKSRMEKLTYFDQLTGVYNRHRMYQIIDRELARDRRYKTDLSLILFDLDKFKDINDTYGHLMGDKLLNEIAQMIRQYLRANDCVFRFGGDEFLILLPNTDLQGSKRAAEKVLSLIRAKTFEGFPGKVSLSMGVVQFDREETREELIARADEMLYVAKEQGRDQAVF